mmetsp:Transcript_22224/g.40915  ORF Transcript_22224/g.40915 Transcript_22224/m.40915 type:complete len:91 (+) Transcript_22224:47-319(+)
MRLLHHGEVPVMLDGSGGGGGGMSAAECKAIAGKVGNFELRLSVGNPPDDIKVLLACPGGGTGGACVTSITERADNAIGGGGTGGPPTPC